MSIAICERDTEKLKLRLRSVLTVHHLILRQKKGHYGPKINICSACHRQIHTLFDNTHLVQEFNSKEKLINEAQMQKFIKWVKKQDPTKKLKSIAKCR